MPVQPLTSVFDLTACCMRSALLPPTNNGSRPCITSWNMSLMEEMVDDYVNATAFDTDQAPYFLFSQVRLVCDIVSPDDFCELVLMYAIRVRAGCGLMVTAAFQAIQTW